VKRKIISILFAVVLVLTLGLVTAAPAAAAVINVPGDYTTIQAAIDAAQPDDTIRVAAGPYQEELFIDKSLKLIGVGEPVIEAPDSLTARWGTLRAVVWVEGDIDVTIKGFVIDGRGVGNANYVFNGIVYFEASGKIEDNEIKAIRNTSIDGVQHGMAIFVSHVWDVDVEHHVFIRNNYIHDYQKGGITVNELGATAMVKDNTIIGAGQIDVIAQNGIQVGFGAGPVTIQNNTVEGNWYTGTDWTAAGVLICGADGNSLTRNEVDANEIGVDIAEDVNYGYGTSDNNKVVNNTISNSDVGVYISGDNNKVIRNIFEGNDANIDDEGTATKQQANRF